MATHDRHLGLGAFVSQVPIQQIGIDDVARYPISHNSGSADCEFPMFHVCTYRERSQRYTPRRNGLMPGALEQ